MKLLVANRGEIAIRILRAAAEMHIPTVAVAPQDDAGSLHTGKADEAPLFRTTVRKTKALTRNSMTDNDTLRMVKRRLRDAKLPARKLSPHSFRATTITDLLEQGVPLEDVQYLAGHSDPRVTRLYDRRKKEVTRNIVERISV